MAYYAIVSDLFSEAECDAIRAAAGLLERHNGTVEGEVLVEIRRCGVRKWVQPNGKRTDWVIDRIFSAAVSANRSGWQFAVDRVIGKPEVTEYLEGGYYEWHRDQGYGRKATRKLSVTVQLSNPSDYEGGELLLFGGVKPKPMPRKQGTAIIFPSYILHRVNPVMRGSRVSLVGWMGSDEAFK